MRTILRLALAAMLLAVLTGCWDTDKLVNKKIVNGIALDVADRGRVLGTASTIKLINKGGGQFDEVDEVLQATGNSVTEIGILINNMMPGKLEASKTHIVILGEELAKKGVLSMLEVFYRNPRGNLNSSFLIAKGKAADILAVGKTPTGSPIAFDIMQMIQGAQFASIVPKQTLYTLWTELLDPDADIVIPIIGKRANNHLVIENVALMNGDKYTGTTMNQLDSKLLLLMMGKMSTTTMLDIPLSELAETIVYEVTKSSNRLRIRVDPATGAVECDIKVKLRGDVKSYPLTGDVDSRIDTLRTEVEASLSKQAARIVAKLKAARCDALGIGRKIKLSHPGIWKSSEWKDVYPDVKVTTEFEIDFGGTGVLN